MLGGEQDPIVAGAGQDLGHETARDGAPEPDLLPPLPDGLFEVVARQVHGVPSYFKSCGPTLGRYGLPCFAPRVDRRRAPAPP